MPRSPRDLDKVYATFPALAEKRALPAGSLSGGQQQMLAIGRALMARRKLLLLDEPSMGLAPLAGRADFRASSPSSRTGGLTVLLVEQNVNAALAIADRAYVIETGRITMSGSGASLLDDERVRLSLSRRRVPAGLIPAIAYSRSQTKPSCSSVW